MKFWSERTLNNIIFLIGLWISPILLWYDTKRVDIAYFLKRNFDKEERIKYNTSLKVASYMTLTSLKKYLPKKKV